MVLSARPCNTRFRRPLLPRAALLLLPLAISSALYAQSSCDQNMLRIVKKDSRYALFLNGKPYVMLAAQVNNSSAWPSMLPKVWAKRRISQCEYA
jgi:hypothetical protein